MKACNATGHATGVMYLSCTGGTTKRFPFLTKKGPFFTGLTTRNSDRRNSTRFAVSKDGGSARRKGVGGQRRRVGEARGDMQDSRESTGDEVLDKFLSKLAQAQRVCSEAADSLVRLRSSLSQAEAVDAEAADAAAEYYSTLSDDALLDDVAAMVMDFRLDAAGKPRRVCAVTTRAPAQPKGPILTRLPVQKSRPQKPRPLLRRALGKSSDGGSSRIK